jgi:hypothetical protein
MIAGAFVFVTSQRNSENVSAAAANRQGGGTEQAPGVARNHPDRGWSLKAREMR